MDYPQLHLDVERIDEMYSRREVDVKDLSARLRQEFISRGYSLAEYSITEDWKGIPKSISVKSEILLPFEDDVSDITRKLNITVFLNPKYGNDGK